MDTFGTVCRNVRVLKGLSQVEVATRGEIFQSRVSEIERDTYAPGLDLARSIARGLDVKLSALIAATEGGMTAEEIVAGASVVKAKEAQGVIDDDPQLAGMARTLRSQVIRAAEELVRRRARGGPTPHTSQPKAKGKSRASKPARSRR